MLTEKRKGGEKERYPKPKRNSKREEEKEERSGLSHLAGEKREAREVLQALLQRQPQHKRGRK